MSPVADDPADVVVRWLGRQSYTPVWRAMQAFTDARTDSTADEFWIVEHDPVFTQGQAGKAEHVLAAGDIPVVPVDRGGQVTYHGPGQSVIYILVDLQRLDLGVRKFVDIIETSLVQLLADLGIESAARRDAPGVYTARGKIASLGLRIRQNRSFHGLALNVDMDLEPFGRINPCGMAGMAMDQVSHYPVASDLASVSEALLTRLLESFYGGSGARRSDENQLPASR